MVYHGGETVALAPSVSACPPLAVPSSPRDTSLDAMAAVAVVCPPAIDAVADASTEADWRDEGIADVPASAGRGGVAEGMSEGTLPSPPLQSQLGRNDVARPDLGVLACDGSSRRRAGSAPTAAVAREGEDIVEDDTGFTGPPLRGPPGGTRGLKADSSGGRSFGFAPSGTSVSSGSVSSGACPLPPSVLHRAPVLSGISEATGLQEQDESDWSGRVAAERPEIEPVPHIHLHATGGSSKPPLVAAVEAHESSALQIVRGAIQGLQACETQLRRVGSACAEADARAEVDNLRREVQRLKGAPRELLLLSNDHLHALQQDLSVALRNVHTELENRLKCCICKVQEREVVLQPCMHLVLCRECAPRVTSCPLCRREIESHTSVRVA